MQIWLVTGAAGFIGSNLCAHLIAQGRHVVGVDNFLSGKRANLERLMAPPGPGRFEFAEADIRFSHVDETIEGKLDEESVKAIPLASTRCAYPLSHLSLLPWRSRAGTVPGDQGHPGRRGGRIKILILDEHWNTAWAGSALPIQRICRRHA